MSDADLPEISPERWRDKFTARLGDGIITPAPAGTAEILAQLRAGTLPPGEAAARLVKLGIPAGVAAAIAEDNGPGEN